MNIVSIIGRLGADPEIKYTPTGKPVSKMSVAVNDGFGENQRTYWFHVICWNGLAETVSQYLRKGSKAAVSGRLTTRSYDKDGANTTVSEIIANSVDFLDPKPDQDIPKQDVRDDSIPF